MARGDSLDEGRHEDGSHLAAGTELAGYRIESLLGRGGMGVVYRARDLALDRNVALKLLAPELADDVGFRERFLRESRLAASLDHPAIVPIYDAGEVAGRLYIAMRLVEGTDLKRLVADEGVLKPERALGLLEQVADALDAAHERGLVHRDVKPSNVLVDERGHCYLADFGLSRRLVDETARSGDARSLGTADYVAPEQIRGETVDGRADLYSLGCLLYECLAGRPPFARASETAVVFAHLEEEPPTLPGFASVIGKALAKDPAGRYQSGRELIAAAREALAPSPSRRRLVLAALAVLVAAGAAAVGVLATHGKHTGARPAVRQQTLPLKANALSLVDARTHHVVASVPAARHGVADLAFLGRSTWLSIPEESRLVRVDLKTRRVTKVVKLPWMPTDRIAAGGGIVWVREARNLGTHVIGVDAQSGRVVRRFSIGGSSIGIAYGAGSLWLVGGGEVVRVDPRSGRILHHFPASADLLVYADGALWAASAGGSIWKIDPIGQAIAAHTKLHPYVSDLAVGGGSVWVSVVGENRVYQLSEDDLGVQQAAPAGPDPERIATGGGTVWIANTSGRAVSRLDETSGARTNLATGSEPTALQLHNGVVWVPARRGRRPLPQIAGQEIRISTPWQFFNLDPVSRVFPMDEQLTSATCANLLEYGPNGLHPVVAAAMPALSNGGRTYTFRIRRGFRFSPPSNEPVTAATFRYTIERTLSPDAQNYPYYAPEIVGLEAYTKAIAAGKTAHISGIRAHGMNLSITLARPAGDLPARLALTLFCPVPLSTPLDPKRVTGPVASDGPYYVASAEGDRIVLLRNPNYGGNRARRPARIVITDDVPDRKGRRARRRRASRLPPQRLRRRDEPARAARRARPPLTGREAPPLVRAGSASSSTHNRCSTWSSSTRNGRSSGPSGSGRPSNTHSTDRRWRTRTSIAPAERVVELPGYGPGDVYPLSRPDLRTARRLAGPKHRHAVLLMPCDFSASGAADILRSNLARIGMTVQIVRFGGCDPKAVPARFRKADMMIGAALTCGACERDPAVFLQGVLEHGAHGSPLPPGPWSAPAFQAQLERAAPLRGQARVEAYRHLDDELARYAPFAVYGSYLYGEYFGTRVGCERFSPFTQGVDLGSLCLRKA